MIVTIIFATSAVLGFAREAVLASYFGVSGQYDAFIVAFVIPSFFLAMLGEASMGAAVVPVFLSFIAPEESREQRRILGSAYLLLSLVLTALTALGIALAPQLARMLAPGFSASQLEITAQLMRLMLPTVLILGLANFVTGLLHSLRRFGIAASTGVVYNLAVVLATIPLAGRLGIVAPAIGVLAGATLQLGIMVPSLIKAGLFPAIGISFKDAALLRMWRIFWPILAGALIVTALQAVDKVVGSFLPPGSLSALSYASKIAGGPPRVFAMAVAVVLFPELVKKVVDGDGDRGGLIVRGISIAAFVTLPWMGLLIALRQPVTGVLLQRGAFSAADTAVVALPLAIYCLGEFASGIMTLVNSAFYSHEDSHTPTLIYIGTYVVRIGIIVSLVPFMGYLGIAAGHVVVINAQFVVLLLLLRRRHVAALDLGWLALQLAKIGGATVVGALVGGLAYAPIARLLPASPLGMLAALAAASLPALVAYYLVARVLRCDAASEFRSRAVDTCRRLAA